MPVVYVKEETGHGQSIGNLGKPNNAATMPMFRWFHDA
jgi:hypothetical protein